ncbi:ATP-binding cassette domain-containing protein [bacterium]|jgi:phospholipid/cholesterol/gamma-HCH transport system ATP-binding protein|nr:ATP-binding cassette domain-containing protein [bacterium]
MSIRFENVHKAFGPKKVLDGVSFEVSKGEVLFILGKSGMGKSVTLKHIIGVLEPDLGRIFVDQYEVSSLFTTEGRDLLPKVRQRCGMVFQHPALLDSLSNYENIAFGLRTPQYREKTGRTPDEDEIRRIVLEKLSLVHLTPDILELHPAEVSYGVQKRVSMARTLAPGPEYLLFDEPTTGLDPLSTSSINSLIFELSRKLKVTSLIVSHDMACALSIADQILFLDRGKIILMAPPREVVKSEIPLVKDFFEETLSLLPPDWRFE